MESIDYEKRFRKLRNGYIILAITIASSIIIALVAVNIRISSSIEKRNSISSIINISGRQRMLSQSIAKLSLLISERGDDTNELISDMDSLLILFKESHTTLLSYDNSIDLNAKFEIIQPSFDALYSAAKEFIVAPDLDKRTRIIQSESEFLPLMDDLVNEYDKLGSKGYIVIHNNVQLSNYSVILLVIIAAITTYLVAIRIVRIYTTELSNRSTELREMQVELEKSRVKEQFAYIASHDLQEPVRTIISLSKLLRQSHSSELNAEGEKIVEFIEESSHRMKRLIRGLLDYSRLGKNQELEEINLNEVLDSISKDLQTQIEETNTTLKYPKLPSIIGYRLDINSIFQNLISNAIKFGKSSGDSNVKIGHSESDKYWFFSVEDNGIGVEEKDRDKIFQLFQRLHNRNKFDGVGIGLAHCKRIVEIHRGGISVDSKIGEGSVFHFSISKELV